MNTKIEKPIFVIGSPRSGTTLLYNMLAKHNDLVYFTDRSEEIFSANLDWNELKDWDKSAPNEGPQIWEHFTRGESHYRTRKDLTDKAREFYLGFIAKHLEVSGKKRFMAKRPRLSLRIDYLDSLFPDAQFIYLKRDAKAIARSIWEKQLKRNMIIWGAKPRNWQKLLELPPIAIAYYQVKMLEDDIAFQLSKIQPSRTYELTYENLIQDTEAEFSKLLKYTELEFSDEFKTAIGNFELSNRNSKLDQLPELESQILTAATKLSLEEFKERLSQI